MIRKLFLVCCCLAMMVQAAWGTDRVDADNRAFHQDLSSLTLFQCIEIALEQNQKQRISKLAVD
ncbi:MAG: hypothetical protein PVI54_18440, partial [Desulfobacteraceae bacterium]